MSAEARRPASQPDSEAGGQNKGAVRLVQQRAVRTDAVHRLLVDAGREGIKHEAGDDTTRPHRRPKAKRG